MIFHDAVDSTNRIALEMPEAPHLTVVTADSQTGGRGRMGRKYFSYGGGLYMSVILDAKKIGIPLHLCTPAAAVAVFEALRELGVSDLRIKWVNDLYRNGKKICGILTECRSDNNGISRIVVGIGINLTNPEDGFPEEIKHKAGCTDYCGDKITLATAIAKRLGELVSSTRSTVVEAYREKMAWIGEQVTVTDYADGNKKVEGTVVGITDDCFLMIDTDDGSRRILSSGEIVK